MMSEWTFFSNHGHVMVCLARNNEARLRDVAADVGITERAVQKIVSELQEAGYVTISKHGRCNRYRISAGKALRHPLEENCSIGQVLEQVCGSERRGRRKPEPAVAPDVPKAPAVAVTTTPVPVKEMGKSETATPDQRKAGSRRDKPRPAGGAARAPVSSAHGS